jgi:hypothetical protein
MGDDTMTSQTRQQLIAAYAQAEAALTRNHTQANVERANAAYRAVLAAR